MCSVYRVSVNFIHNIVCEIYNMAKPHISVPCPFCNHYPISFQLDTWYYCGNCFKLMLWVWCQCFRSNFLILQYESLSITQYVPELSIFVFYTWACCLSSNRGNNKNTFDLCYRIICVVIPYIHFWKVLNLPHGLFCC